MNIEELLNEVVERDDQIAASLAKHQEIMASPEKLREALYEQAKHFSSADAEEGCPIYEAAVAGIPAQPTEDFLLGMIHASRAILQSVDHYQDHVQIGHFAYHVVSESSRAALSHRALQTAISNQSAEACPVPEAA
jgi:hypothetical protein